MFQKRANNTTRPAFIEVRTEDKRRVENNEDVDLYSANDNETLMLAFLETIDVETGATALPDFDNKNEVNLFFKYYNPRLKTLAYCGHAYVDLRSHPSSLFPMLCERAGLPEGTKLLFFEEIKTGHTEQTRTDKKFEEVCLLLFIHYICLPYRTKEMLDNIFVTLQIFFLSVMSDEQFFSQASHISSADLSGNSYLDKNFRRMKYFYSKNFPISPHQPIIIVLE